eukprot:4798523-Prymnesium_polylepis.2
MCRGAAPYPGSTPSRGRVLRPSAIQYSCTVQLNVRMCVNATAGDQGKLNDETNRPSTSHVRTNARKNACVMPDANFLGSSAIGTHTRTHALRPTCVPLT